MKTLYQYEIDGFYVPGGEIFTEEADIPAGYTDIAPPNGLYRGQWTGQAWIEGMDGKELAILLLSKAAADIRSRRDTLLAESDKDVALDRVWPAGQAESGVLEEIAAKLTPWAQYRQALRDVPQQPGFPRAVTWPVRPA